MDTEGSRKVLILPPFGIIPPLRKTLSTRRGLQYAFVGLLQGVKPSREAFLEAQQFRVMLSAW